MSVEEVLARHGPEPSRLKLKVVILGGGFAGVYCGRRLARELRVAGLDPMDAAIVSDQNYMVFQPMLAEVAGGSIEPRHVVNPIRRLCRGLRVYRGEVVSVDTERREVKVDTGSFSAGVLLAYEHLVFALGAEIDLRRVPGMPEHALVMQNVGDAMILRATIIRRIEEANAEYRAEVRRRLLTIVVVGGGYSGVETAGELLDMLREVAKFYLNVSPDDIKVILVHSRDRILNSISPSLGDYAAGKLRERGLELILEERVTAVTSTKVYLASGRVIETATVVSTVGTAPNRVVRGLCERGELPHEGFRVLTDGCLRVEGRESLWAAGDCARVPLAGSKEEACPQTAQFAMRQGEQVARNLGAALRGEAPSPFLFKGLGELASIGHRIAVAQVFGMRVSGFLAWFLWRSVYLSKLPGLDRKLRVMIDWTLDLFFPRDINLLNPRYTKLYREVYLEPGDVLFNRGEPAFSLYVVKEGRIDLLDRRGGAVRSIGQGDYFGERALVHGGGYLYDAVATERTRLVSLGGEVVLPFIQSSHRFRRIFARTTAQVSAEGELRSVESKLPPEVLVLPLSEVMQRDVAVLRLDQSVSEALGLFLERRFSTYPVVDGEDRVVGAISREDVFDFMKREDAEIEASLEQIDGTQLPRCRPEATVHEALEHMLRYGCYKCLVVDEESRLVGVVAALDVLARSARG